tara:strand:+ start:602 stop:1156 length:555 start_codon:yes stop_codon:yes gene_type:complete
MFVEIILFTFVIHKNLVMKNYLSILVLTIFLTATYCGENVNKKDSKSENLSSSAITDATDSPIMSFDKTLHDFGNIKEGETVETIFTFTNTGKSDLIIVDARGSCGCTVPEYPKNTPIPPGEGGKIKVSFDSSNKPNMQQKTVTISANTNSGRETIRIKALVQADPVKQKQRDAAAAARAQQNN